MSSEKKIKIFSKKLDKRTKTLYNYNTKAFFLKAHVIITEDLEVMMKNKNASFLLTTACLVLALAATLMLTCKQPTTDTHKTPETGEQDK